MAYYSYSNITREITEISDFPLSPGDDCATSEVVGVPKHILEATYVWNPQSCVWELRSKRTITKLAYMNRFTDTELASIYTLAKQVVALEIWLDKFKLAEEIDLDDPRTLAGLQALVAGGILSPSRIEEILA